MINKNVSNQSVSGSNTLSDEQEQVLTNFVKELEESGPENTNIEIWIGNNPELKKEFIGLKNTFENLETARPEVPIPIPEQLGDFRIIRRLARGGMGDVYLAEQKTLNRLVALKTIRHGKISKESEARFLREQEVLASLHQTNIVPIHTAGNEDDLQYFAMPYIKGTTLHQVLQMASSLSVTNPHSRTPSLGNLAKLAISESSEQGKLLSTNTNPDSSNSGTWLEHRQQTERSEPRQNLLKKPSLDYFRSIARVFIDIANAIQHAHQAGILHRDLKPSNIMVDENEQSWVIDFGLAGQKNGVNYSEQIGNETQPDSLTQTGRFVGTPAYMAPEQFQGEADERTDVWGLGVTLYEMMTGQKAFDEKSVSKFHEKISGCKLSAPRRINERVPRDLEAICLKALKPQKKDRYQSLQFFADDLRHWLKNEPVSARFNHPPRRFLKWSLRNKGWASSLVLAISALVSFNFFIYFYQESRRQEQESRRQEQESHRLEMQQANAVLEAQRIRQSQHENGWRQTAIEKLKFENKIDIAHRNHLAAAFVGIDASRNPPVETAASSLAFDPAGKRLLVGALDDKSNSLIYSLRQTRTTQTKISGSGPVAFLDDGTPVQLLAGQNQSLLTLVNLQTSETLRDFSIPSQTAASKLVKNKLNIEIVAITSDVSHIAAALEMNESGNYAVVVRDGLTAEKIGLFKSAEKISSISLSDDGTLLAIATVKGQIRIWSLEENKIVSSYNRHRIPVHCVEFQKDYLIRKKEQNKTEKSWILASGDAGGNILIWDIAANSLRSICRGSHYDIFALAFRNDGAVLASGGRNRAKLWDVATGRLIMNITSGDEVTSVRFSSDGQKLAIAVNRARTIESEPVVLIWNLEYGIGIGTLRGLSSQISKVAFSADGSRIAALSHDWYVGIWELPGQKLLRVLEVSPGVTADNAGLVFSPDGKKLAFSAGKEATLWDIEAPLNLDSWDFDEGYADVIRFTAKNELLLFRVETQNGNLTESWEHNPRIGYIRKLLSDHNMERVLKIEEFPRGVVFSEATSDGRYFIVEGFSKKDGRDRLVKVFDTSHRQLAWPAIEIPGGAREIFPIDPNGKIFAIQTEEFGQFSLLNVADGKIVGTIIQEEEKPSIGAISPAARYFVSGLRILRAGCKLYDQHKLTSQSLSLGIDTRVGSFFPQFSLNGNSLAWGNEDGTVFVVDIPEIRRQLKKYGIDW